MKTTKRQRAAQREMIVKQERGTTHWKGCEAVHRSCFQIATIDDLELLLIENKRLSDNADDIAEKVDRALAVATSGIRYAIENHKRITGEKTEPKLRCENCSGILQMSILCNECT